MIFLYHLNFSRDQKKKIRRSISPVRINKDRKSKTHLIVLRLNQIYKNGNKSRLLTKMYHYDDIHFKF